MIWPVPLDLAIRLPPVNTVGGRITVEIIVIVILFGKGTTGWPGILNL
ncbi:MAG: hypothetical protein GX162_11780 [Firmicutes bacterium]|nr:hypothetical protein [Bacillota bacterium]